MLNHRAPQQGEQVLIHRGTYQGRQGTIVRYTPQKVYVRLLDDRQVCINQTSLEPREESPPLHHSTLVNPSLEVGQHVEVYSGTYRGDSGMIRKLTPCMVYVKLDRANKEVRISQSSVRVARSQRRSSSSPFTAIQDARNSDFTEPQNLTPNRSYESDESTARPVTPDLDSNPRYSSRPSPRRSVATATARPTARTVTPTRFDVLFSSQNQSSSRLGTHLRQESRAQTGSRGTSQRESSTSVSTRTQSRSRTTAGTPRNQNNAGSPTQTNFVRAAVASNTRRGTRERIVSSLPVTIVDDPESLSENCRECSICLESFVREDRFKTLPCEHVFHHQCIDPWIRGRPCCPLCRCRLVRDVALPH